MIGPKVRWFLTAAALVYIAVGVFRAATAFFPDASGPSAVVAGVDWERVAWSLMTPMIESGVLLVLLSIDRRLERKAL